MNKLKSSIGKRIAALRKDQDLTQEQLAELLNVSEKHISSIERGKSILSLEKLIRASEILDVSLDYLITGSNYNFSEAPFPKSTLEIFQSGDPTEMKLFVEYLRLYNRIRQK